MQAPYQHGTPSGMALASSMHSDAGLNQRQSFQHSASTSNGWTPSNGIYTGLTSAYAPQQPTASSSQTYGLIGSVGSTASCANPRQPSFRADPAASISQPYSSNGMPQRESGAMGVPSAFSAQVSIPYPVPTGQVPSRAASTAEHSAGEEEGVAGPGGTHFACGSNGHFAAEPPCRQHALRHWCATCTTFCRHHCLLLLHNALRYAAQQQPALARVSASQCKERPYWQMLLVG